MVQGPNAPPIAIANVAPDTCHTPTRELPPRCMQARLPGLLQTDGQPVHTGREIDARARKGLAKASLAGLSLALPLLVTTLVTTYL